MSKEILRNAHGILMAAVDDHIYGIVNMGTRWHIGHKESVNPNLDEYVGYRGFDEYRGGYDGEAEAIPMLEIYIEHHKELRTLDRPVIDNPIETPGGLSVAGWRYREGITKYKAKGYWAFLVAPEQNAIIPDPYRNWDGWYQSELDGAKVVDTFPELFTVLEKRNADQVLRDWHPDEYEAVHGIALRPDQSSRVASRLSSADYAKRSASRWVIQSIVGLINGNLRVLAELKGRGLPPDRRIFDIPGDEFSTRKKGSFFVDPARHTEIPLPGKAPLDINRNAPAA